MKIIIFFVPLIALLICPVALSAPRPFKIDSNHSNIGFAVPIAGGLSKVRGKFTEFKINLAYDDKDITKSSVDVKIVATSIDTGIDQRDVHLRSTDFFDIEKFPEITFKSSRVEKKVRNVTVFGSLTMRGVTKPISFPLVFTGRQFEAGEKLLTLGFAAELKIDRRDFGIDYQHESVPDFIGNIIEVEINIITRAAKAE